MSTVKNNQSTLDIATQLNGDVRSVIRLCIENNLSITDDLIIGSAYTNPDDTFTNDIIKDSFVNKETILTTSEPKVLKEVIGIGTMIISSDFDIINTNNK